MTDTEDEGCDCCNDPMILAGNSIQIIDVVGHLMYMWLTTGDPKMFHALVEFPTPALVMGLSSILQGVGRGCEKESNGDLHSFDVIEFLLKYGSEHAATEITEVVREMIQCPES